MDCFHDMIGSQVQLTVELVHLARSAEPVIDPDDPHRYRPVLDQDFCNSAPEAADDIVLLDRNDGAGSCGLFDDPFLCQRFDRCTLMTLAKSPPFSAGRRP